MEEAVGYRAEMLRTHNVKKAALLPLSIRNKVVNRFHLVKAEFNRQRKYHRAVTLYNLREGTLVMEPKEWDKQDVHWVDDFPSPDEVDGDVLTADQVSTARACSLDCADSQIVPLPKQPIQTSRRSRGCCPDRSHRRRRLPRASRKRTRIFYERSNGT
jgi:hypothetical protein